MTHNGPLDRRERIAATWLAAPPGSVVSGLTGLELDGLRGFEDSRVFLTLPQGRRPTALPPSELHWSTCLELGVDVHVARTPRRTIIARSLVDAASWSAHQRHARVLIIAAFQQGLVQADAVTAALERRGTCRHRALIVESVLDALGGIQSLPERDFTWIWRVLGLPPPTRQQRLKGADGQYYLDAYWRELDLAVEIHGAPHRAVNRWDADVVRANEVAITGSRVLVFTSFAIRRERAVVADQLLRMARRCGWTGQAPTREEFLALDALERRPAA
ncbi:hypothetical protein BHE97_04335 [Aeromicrobium sp. PE09-221]|nr:hypothetical protein BHE97_04335 [Aeromicrobium sp. PE09-221]